MFYNYYNPQGQSIPCNTQQLGTLPNVPMQTIPIVPPEANVAIFLNTIKAQDAEIQRMKMEQQLQEIKKANRKNLPGHFYKDLNNIYVYVKGNNKDTIVGVLNITKITFVIVHNRHGISNAHLMIEYYGESGAKDVTIVPYEKFLDQHLLPYFPEFRMSTDCTKPVANKCLYNEINNNLKNNDTIEIQDVAGFTITADGISFCSGQNYDKTALWKVVPDSLRNKMFTMHETSASDLSYALSKLMMIPVSATYVGYHVSGVLSGVFRFIGIIPSQILVIASGNPNAPKTIASYLNTFNKPSFSVCTLDSSKNEITKTLKEANGEVIVLGDISLKGNDKKRTETLELLVKDMLVDDTLPHLIAVVSNAAQYLLPTENQFVITPDNQFFSRDEKELTQIQLFIEKIDSCVIKYVCNNFKEILNFLKTKSKMISKIFADKLNNNSLNTYIMLSTSIELLQKIFGIEPITQATSEFIYTSLLESNNTGGGNEYAILDEFSAVINRLITEDQLRVIIYSTSMHFEKDSGNIIKKDELLYMESSTLSDVIVPQMTVTSNTARIIKELKNVGVLSTTNNNTHPIRIVNAYGFTEHISMYAFKYHELLTQENIDLIDENGDNGFWLKANELPENFMPFVCKSNRVAGRNAQYYKEENCHISVTGKSGQGKTVFMSQHIVNCHKNGDRVIILDSSGSFSKDKLYANLSKEYVDENITYHSIEEEGIPVNLFDLSDASNLPRKKNAISGILISAVKNMSDTQSKKLKSVLSSCIDKEFDFIKLLNILGDMKKDSVAVTLFNKLFDVYDDLDTYGCSSDTWGKFIAKSQGIVIVTMDNMFAEKGNYIFDMLLASLFNFQSANDDRQMSIFIDEIQNQNLGTNGPVWKIVKEGRKYHMGLIFATQLSSNGGEPADRIIKEAGTHVFFKPSVSSEFTVANMLGFGKKELYKLRKLKIGECFVKGDLYDSQLDCNDSAVIKGRTHTHFNSFEQ